MTSILSRIVSSDLNRRLAMKQKKEFATFRSVKFSVLSQRKICQCLENQIKR